MLINIKSPKLQDNDHSIIFNKLKYSTIKRNMKINKTIKKQKDISQSQ
jgi:hypothetical protein